MMRMLDVCSGIGGISLGAHLTGAIETVAFSEVEAFPSAVLAHHWPHIPNLGDIHGITKTRLASAGLLPIDILAGGFPCQPFSTAGKRKGQADTRNLWGEMARLVGEIEPEWLVGENVFGLLSVGVERGKHHGYFGDIQRDLARLGYASGWCVLSAADAGAPHLRKRVFILANRDGERIERAMRHLADAKQRGWHPGQQWNSEREAGATAALRGREQWNVGHTGNELVRERADIPGNLDETNAEAAGRRQGSVCHAAARSGCTMGDTDRRECRGWTNSEGHQPHGAATRWHESDGEPESAGERSGTMAHAGNRQCERGPQFPGGWHEISAGQQLRHDAGGCDGSGVGMADTNDARPQKRDGRSGTRGACTTADGRGERQAEPRLGMPTDGISRWVVGRFPAGPGQAQEDWEATRVVSQTVPLRAAKLKALGNSVMPLQIYPVFAAIVATEQAMEVRDAA